MNKRLKVKGWQLGLAAAVIGMLLVGVGMMIRVNQLVAHSLPPLMQAVAAENYVQVAVDERSFFRHQLDYLIELPFGDALPSLRLNNRITKWPWAVAIQHEVYLQEADLSMQPAELADVIRSNFLAKPLASGVTVQSISGALKTDWVSAAINESLDGQVSFKMAPLQLQMTGRQGQIDEGVVTVPDFYLAQPAAAQVFQLQGLRYAFAGGLVKVAASASPLSGFLNGGEQTLSVEKLLLQISQNELTEMAVLNVSSAATVQDDQWAANISLAIDSLLNQSAAEKYHGTDLSLSAAASGLAVENLSRFIRQLDDYNSGNADLGQITADLNALVQQGFRLSLNEASGKLNEHPVDLRATVVVAENGVADMNNPFSFIALLSYLDIDIRLAIDRSIFTLREVAQLLEPLITLGVLVVEGDQYGLDFKLQDGQPELNGEPLMLPI